MAQANHRTVSSNLGSANVNLLSTFRSFGRNKRAQMNGGALLELVTRDGQEVIAEMPLKLFNALSEQPKLLQTNDGVHRITLPPDVLPVAVKELVASITTLTDPAVNVYPMDSTGNLFKDIHIASAADQLGLRAYTQRMLNSHWQRFKTSIPAQSDVDIISKIDTPLGNKLFAMFARDFARLAFDSELPNPSAFQAYLATNPRFSAAITEQLAILRSNADAFAAREERRQQRERQAVLAKERAHKAALDQTKKRKKEQAKFDAQKKEEKEVGERVREKMRVKGSKYTAAEARYVWRVMGKRVPVGVGK